MSVAFALAGHAGRAEVAGTALVRHAPTINGTVQGSVQQMSAESVGLNGGAEIAGDLLVPGTPAVRLNGKPDFGGTVPGEGAASPSNFTVTLNGNATLGRLRTRTDALALPIVTAPAAPKGTRAVAVNRVGDAIGDFATVRSLTLNGNVGQVTVPAGTYGDFTANGSAGFTLGVAGATEPSVYAFQHLTLNGNSGLQVVGPVIITVASGFTANGVMGAPANPAWLSLRITSGDFTLNGNVNVYGYVLAPAGTVTINGNSTLVGGVMSDRLTLNGSSTLKLIDALPTVTLTAPAAGAVFRAPASSITLSASAGDGDGAVAKVEFFAGTTKLGERTAPDVGGATYTLACSLATPGTYALAVKATDNAGGVTSSAPASIIVDAPPTIAIVAPADGALVTAPADIAIPVNAADSDGTVAKVEFFQGATKIGESTTAPFTFTWPAVPYGRYTVTAVATDNLGMSTTSGQVTVLVNQPPTATLIAPATGTTVIAPSTVALSATAADVDGTIAKVEFYSGTTKLGEVASATGQPATFSLPFSFTAPGTFEIVAIATDDRGASTRSAPAALKVDAPPVVSLTAPSDGAVVVAPNAVSLSANASDPDGTIAKIEFFQGNVSVGVATAAPYRVTVSGLAPGRYSFTAKATDDVGATATSAPVAVVVDAPPTVSLTSPADGTVITAPGTATLQATASDPDGTIAKVEFFNGATKLGESATAPYQYVWSNVAAGTYTVTAKATDNVGAVTNSVPVTFIVDSRPSANSDAFTLSSTGTAAITLQASDADGDLLTYTIVSPPAHGVLSGTAPNLVYTASGNPGQADTFTFKVNDGKFDSAAASISIQLAPVAIAATGNAGGVVVDAATGKPIAGVTVRIDGMQGSVTADSTGRFAVQAGAFDPVIPLKLVTVVYEAPGYISSYQRVIAYPGVPVTTEPVFLKRRDEKETPIGSAGGVATNSTGDVVAEFPVGAVAGSIPVHLTRYDFGRELPGALPESSAFTYAVDLAPEGAAFSSPVTVKIANVLGFAAGTPIPVGVFNPGTVRWEHESMGRVSADGAWVVFQVLHFSARDANVPPDKNAPKPSSESDDAEEEWDPSEVQRDPGVSIADGNYETAVALATYQSLERSRGLRFVYNSTSASGIKPYSIAGVKEGGSEVPLAREYRLDVAGHNYQATFAGGPTEQNGTSFGSFAVDMTSLPTGLYPYRKSITDLYRANYATTTVFGGSPVASTGVAAREAARLTSTSSGWLPWINARDSVYGAGWSLAGVSSIHPGADAYRVMVENGDGGYKVYLRRANYVRTAKSTRVFNELYPVIRRDGADGLIVADDTQIIHVDAAMNTNVLFDVGNVYSGYGQIRDLALAQSGTIYFAFYRGQFNAVNPLVPVAGIYRLVAGSRTPELVAEVASGDPYSMTLDAHGSIYVYVQSDYKSDHVDAIWKYSDSGVRTLFVDAENLAKGWGWIERIVYDNVNDRLLVWADEELWQKPQVGEPSAFYAPADPLSAVIAWNPQPTVDADGNVWLVEDSWGNGDVRAVVRISSDGTVNRTPTPGDYDYKPNFPDIAFAYVNAWEVTSTGQLWVYYENSLGPVESSSLRYFAENGSHEEVEQTSAGWTWRDSHGQSRMFDASGKVLSEVDRDGNETSYAYDGRQRLQSVTDPVGAVTRIAYDGSGRIASISDPAGRNTLFTVNAAGDLVAVTLPGGARQSFEYDSTHRMTRKTDARGNSTTFTIDAKGHYTEIAYADGTKTSFTAQRVLASQASDPTPGVNRGLDTGLPASVSASEPDQITDPRGNVTRWKLDSRGYLKSTSDATGASRAVGRDSLDHIVSKTDGRGGETKFEYDSMGNVTSMLLSDGIGIETYEYDPTFNLLTKRTDANGHSTVFDRDASGRVTKITDALGNFTSFTYNSRGQVLTTTDPLGNVTTTAYDSLGNVQSVTDPLGHATRFSRDSSGAVSEATDPVGSVTAYSYDQRNRVTKVTAADGGSTSFTYDANGNLVTTTDPLGGAATREYDSRDRLTKVTTVTGAVTEYTYDSAGNRSSIKDPLGQTQTFTYDAANRLVAVTDALSHSTAFTYDNDGNVTAVADPLGRTKKTEFDALSRPTKIIATDGGETSMTYDEAGNRTSLTDPLGHKTSWTYDAMNRVTDETNALGKSRTFAYDAVGNLTTATNRRRQSVTRTFDDAGRLTGVQIPTDTLTTVYDAAGRPTSVANGAGVLAFTYDAVGRISSATQPAGAVRYEYDLMGNRVRVADAAGTLDYVYDKEHRLSTLTDSKTGSYDFVYDVASRLTGTAYPNGVTTVRTYDHANHLLSMAHVVGTKTLAGVGYSYDASGNRTTATREDDVSTSFSYDSNARILGATAKTGGSPESFIYDKAGNWVPGDRKYDAANQLTEDGAYTYNFDDDGNLVEKRSKSNSADVTTYNWDALNRLTSVSTATKLVEFVYDGLGRRAARAETDLWSNQRKLVKFLYDGDNVRVETAATGDVLAANVHAGLDYLLARSDLASGATHYVHADGLNSTIALTDGGGQVTERYQYSVFGQMTVLSPSGTVLNSGPKIPNTYTGREWDATIGFYNYRSRYYSAQLGRFVSADAMGFSANEVNFYAYVGNNPANLTDPFGFEAEAPNTAGVTTIGGVQFDSNGNAIKVNSSYTSTLTCHGMTAAGQTGAVTQFSGLSAIPGSGPDAQQGYSTLVTLSANAVFTFGPGIAGGIAELGVDASTFVITGLTKSEARAAIANMGFSDAQTAAVNSTISRATTTSSIKVTQYGSDTVVQIIRPGNNGFQVMETVVNQNGTKTVVQRAYDSAGQVVHLHPKGGG